MFTWPALEYNYVQWYFLPMQHGLCPLRICCKCLIMVKTTRFDWAWMTEALICLWMTKVYAKRCTFGSKTLRCMCARHWNNIWQIFAQLCLCWCFRGGCRAKVMLSWCAQEERACHAGLGPIIGHRWRYTTLLHDDDTWLQSLRSVWILTVRLFTAVIFLKKKENCLRYVYPGIFAMHNNNKYFTVATDEYTGWHRLTHERFMLLISVHMISKQDLPSISQITPKLILFSYMTTH